MIVEMFRELVVRWREWRDGRSAASKRLAGLARERAAARHRRLEGNRGHRWSSEPTMLTPTLRPLMTYGQLLGYRVPAGS
ncbi:hypothetical protein EDC02_4877 [Micromonospora sp. Llam0]|uniref:hypothetical protein n=1 Tax=Micromonosporaceae TaxID=28056 RepID=UPI000FB898A8|nr:MULTISPECIES: hypothetical protein [Micromonosporaceae]ROO62878.1 hypothetical protein EDC02_4877 [Micromonospora sp. Llam0]WBB97272.1 hypothetical protein O7553_29160 [Solwaraspora sp. WMMA2059]WBC18828.1 hypothetical protein O7543_18210 [Solwaraspora sp. WMMA2080]